VRVEELIERLKEYPPHHHICVEICLSDMAVAQSENADESWVDFDLESVETHNTARHGVALRIG